jgi:hypothetical protein
VCDIKRGMTIKQTVMVIYIKSEEGKAFVHANCVFVNAIQVNESGLTLESCIRFCLIRK